MRAFIIRPFGIKNDLKGNPINFDEVAEKLISPALAAIGAEGRETLDIVQSGNIRVDMFRRLLTADIVVADLSIHNANVFYEIGIRHALRDHGTFMIRSNADAFPFDLQTDRYFTYDSNNPAAGLPALTTSLKAVLEEAKKYSTVKDSPVFMSLPALTEPDPSLFNPIPQDFGEEVERARAESIAGDLALLANEVKGLEWEANGLRTVGRAQFSLKAFASARVTWEAIRAIEEKDLEADLLLGTIYERLGSFTASTQALERALASKTITSEQRAEAYALLARNEKTEWRETWQDEDRDAKGKTALRSPHLRESYQNYRKAFAEDLNHYYSGLNALALVSIINDLATQHRDVWNELFDTDEAADQELAKQKIQRDKLAATVESSLDAKRHKLEIEDKKDEWVEISAADFLFLTSTRPMRVASAYRDALEGCNNFARDAVQQQLSIFGDLGVVTTNLAEVQKVVGVSGRAPAVVTGERKRVLVFSGHMIDAAGREKPRFPADKEPIAREKIKEAILAELNHGAGIDCGFTGAASGGDILFQEVCAELGIPTQLYLAMQPKDYVKHSVAPAGDSWIDRFWEIYKRQLALNSVRVLSDAIEAKDDEDYLPAWLRAKDDYNIWQRNNLWMLFNALDRACDQRSADPNLTLIALWDGGGGDGPGGTADLVHKVDALGARRVILKTKELFGL